ncbi:hypothetical protein C4D60_Mb10t14720 [Musa balbisiana]|uniref:Uncharacterized protein n=1 Tax=Musa balbisiana TaxID=52838 RepID=A0A4V4H4T5_MUSBA|nr:hypothetical protein C4D60_Mb10t14720 [Musa balbisiana]
MNPNTVATNSDRHHLPPSPCVPSGVPERAPRGDACHPTAACSVSDDRTTGVEGAAAGAKDGGKKVSWNLCSLSGGLVATCVKKLRMHIEANLKRYRTLQKAGEIIMSVRIIAYSQLLQVCQAEYFRQLLKPVT